MEWALVAIPTDDGPVTAWREALEILLVDPDVGGFAGGGLIYDPETMPDSAVHRMSGTEGRPVR